MLCKKATSVLAMCCLLLSACGGGSATVEVAPTTVTDTPSSTPTLAPVPTQTMDRTDSTATSTPELIEPEPEATLPTPIERRVEDLLSRMSQEQKVGQLFVVFFDGTTYSEALDRTIRDLHIGGIVFFGSNINSLEEVASLSNQAQTTAAQTGAQIPLIVAVDHEGGLVDRFGDILTRFPSQMALAATGSVENARAEARVMAAELKALGINMNLAPVMDVNSNPDNPVIGTRSFSSNPTKVAEFGTAMILEFQANGVLATAKHFPGHGDTSVDSHTMLPLVPHERQRLDTVEFLPFRAAIEVDVDAIMTAHVVFPTIDPRPGVPATLSEPVLTGLLRDELGFDGLIATDSLGMGAISQEFGIADASAAAFEAGADLLMFGADPGHSPAEQYPVYQNLVALVRNGTISEERLDASVRRILITKAERGLLDWQPVSLSEITAQVRTEEHLAVAERIAEESVTLVKNDSGVLPIGTGQHVLLVYPAFESELATILPLYGQVDMVPISLDPSQSEIGHVVDLGIQSDVVILVTVNARSHPGQIALVESMQHVPGVVLALQSPYDLLAFPYQPAYLAIYSDVPVSIHAAAKVMFGYSQPTGKLPVRLTDQFPEGYGLDDF